MRVMFRREATAAMPEKWSRTVLTIRELVGHEVESGSYDESASNYLRLPALTPNALRKAR
jgi:hypothetical protein